MFYKNNPINLHKHWDEFQAGTFNRSQLFYYADGVR